MRHRPLGHSDLVVSEVGFGTWTLVTDWWGRTDDPHEMIRAALDAGINFFDTAPVYGADGAGETILREYLSRRDEIVLATKVGYDIDAARKHPGQSERPHDWRPESVRQQVDASLARLGTDHIDLLQLHNPRIEPIVDDALWETLVALREAGKIRELGVALGPAIGWVEEGNISIDDRPITTLQTVFNVLEQEPGLTFAARERVRNGDVSLDRTGAARIRHALGQDHARHRVPARRPPRAPQPRQHARQLREGGDARLPLVGRRPVARSARPRSRASSRIPPSPACSRPCSRSTRCANTRTRPRRRSQPTRSPRSTISGHGTSTTSTAT